MLWIPLFFATTETLQSIRKRSLQVAMDGLHLPHPSAGNRCSPKRTLNSADCAGRLLLHRFQEFLERPPEQAAHGGWNGVPLVVNCSRPSGLITDRMACYTAV